MDTRQLIETYHKAWTSGDFITARRCLADNLDFKGSIDTFQNADDFINALKGFKGMLRGIGILKNYFDHSGGAILYDCKPPPQPELFEPSEFFSVDNGKITEIRLVFDATELRKLMGPS